MGSLEVRYGFLTGIVSIIWALIPLFMGWSETPVGNIFDFAGILIIGVGVYYSVKERKEEQGVLFTFGKAFFTGCVTCFVVAILMGSFYYVYAKYVDPGFAEIMVKKGLEIMAARKKYTSDEIARGVQNIRAMYSPNGQFMDKAGLTMFYGLFVSLVVSVYLARRKPDTTK